MDPAQPWPVQSHQMDQEEADSSPRPSNAFILYSQAMRPTARQRNPSLSNTEISAILGMMWKEVPSDVKLQYKQKAAVLQEEFKRTHPNYSYKKARKRRTLLANSAQGRMAFPGDPNAQAMLANPYFMQMYGQQQLGFGQMQQQGMTDPTHQIYQFQGK
jgi:transcription factor SOX7/8/10/18 (SOX group E/F)